MRSSSPGCVERVAADPGVPAVVAAADHRVLDAGGRVAREDRARLGVGEPRRARARRARRSTSAWCPASRRRGTGASRASRRTSGGPLERLGAEAVLVELRDRLEVLAVAAAGEHDAAAAARAGAHAVGDRDGPVGVERGARGAGPLAGSTPRGGRRDVRGARARDREAAYCSTTMVLTLARTPSPTSTVTMRVPTVRIGSSRWTLRRSIVDAAGLLDRVDDVLRGDGAEQAAVVAGLVGDREHGLVELLGALLGALGGLGGRAVEGLLVALGRGDRALGRRLGELARDQVVAQVALGDVDDRAALRRRSPRPGGGWPGASRATGRGRAARSSRLSAPTYGSRASSRARLTAVEIWFWWRRQAPVMRRERILPRSEMNFRSVAMSL